MRPFLKWLGNKHSCLKHILPHLPNAPRLIEPFTGSGAIFLASEYDNYLLGEKNKDLVNLYTLLRKDNDKFIKKAKKMFSGEFNDEDTYYKLREEFNATRSKQRRAILFFAIDVRKENSVKSVSHFRENSRNFPAHFLSVLAHIFSSVFRRGA